MLANQLRPTGPVDAVLRKAAIGMYRARGMNCDAAALRAGKRKQRPANSQLPVSASLNESPKIRAGVGDLTIICALHGDSKRGDRRVRSQIVFRLGPYLGIDCRGGAQPAA